MAVRTKRGPGRVGNGVLGCLFPGFPCYAPTVQAAFNQLSIAPQL